MQLPHCISVYVRSVKELCLLGRSSSSAAIRTDRRPCNPCLLGLTVDDEVELVRFALAPRTLRGGKAGGVQPSMVAAALLGSSPFALLSQGWSGPSRYDRAYSASSASENKPCSRPSSSVCSFGTLCRSSKELELRGLRPSGLCSFGTLCRSSKELELRGLRPSGLAGGEGSKRKSTYSGGVLAAFRAASLPGEDAEKRRYPAMSLGAGVSKIVLIGGSCA